MLILSPQRNLILQGGWKYTSGSYIRPISMSEAKAWAEEYMEADEYEAIFGPVDE